jgi:hypothetical protein
MGSTALIYAPTHDKYACITYVHLALIMRAFVPGLRADLTVHLLVKRKHYCLHYLKFCTSISNIYRVVLTFDERQIIQIHIINSFFQNSILKSIQLIIL